MLIGRSACITTNWNAISELINDGTNGLLIDSTNLSDLYLFVEKLNSDIYRKMVSNILLSPNKYDCDFLLDFYVTNLKAKEIIL